MNTKTLLTVKTDKNLKEAAQRLADTLGFSLGTLVNAYLKQLVRTKEVVFEESYRPNRTTVRALAETEKEFASGKLPVYKNMEEAIKALRSNK